MSAFTNLTTKCLDKTYYILGKYPVISTISNRFASKKAASAGNKNAGNSRAKHRGWKRGDGVSVPQGTLLATQNKTRWHPGLNVGFGRNGTLWAMHSGKVIITCEKIKPNWEHGWIQKNYADREGQTIYKKHFNIIPEPQHNRFKLITKI